jgi:hypothetical protein
MGGPSDLLWGLSASRHHILRHAKARANLLEVNSDSNGDISTQCRDFDSLESQSAFTALASVYLYFRFHLHGLSIFHRVVAKSKKLFCITRAIVARIEQREIRVLAAGLAPDFVSRNPGYAP